MAGTYWTNPSVLNLVGKAEPIEFVRTLARKLVLDAIQEGWSGPPFDPFELAAYLSVPVSPREDIQDARTLPVGRHVRIEFNPTKPRGRLRFSVAHEIAHTLFPDCAESVRMRGAPQREDAWQLELLCNLIAAEILMPVGTGTNLEREPVNIDNILRLQREYDVSTEAISLRLIKMTREPCFLFAAARMASSIQAPISVRFDYSAASRSAKFKIPDGFKVEGDTVLSECTAVGYTAKGKERWIRGLPPLMIECVGIPPYPGQLFPRVIGVASPERPADIAGPVIRYLWGDALEPRGTPPQIIAQVVNDKTENWGGSGFAREVRIRSSSVQDAFRRWVRSNPANLSLGKTHISKLSDTVLVASMVAQHGYGPSRKPRIRYEALAKCLDEVAKSATAMGASVHMPRIGTGEAGGKWPIVAELIDEALVRKDIEVTVYTLPTTKTLEVQGQLDIFCQTSNDDAY